MSNLPRRSNDPYRELGVARAASAAEIKAAHRTLAKRFHPDASGGDSERFVAVQEAYLLLSDPLRRREWDARHAPGPVRANEPRRARPRGADGRWTREEGVPSPGRSRGAAGRKGARRGDPAATAGGTATGRPGEAEGTETDDTGQGRGKRPSGTAWSGAERPAGTASYRWSAENVPWWEDFRPRDGGGSTERARHGRAGGADATRHGAAGRASQRPAAPPPPPAPPAPPGHPTGADFDVYSRSSGAAWSSAARQYFRKATDDLPSRGSFVYRGTQVVTGAKAREVAEDLLRQRPRVRAAPRQSVDPLDPPGSRTNRTAAHGRAEGPAAGHPSSEAASAPPADPADRAARPATGLPPEHVTHASRHQSPGVVGAAVVGGTAALAVSLPVVALAGIVLDPPLQPTFAVLLLILAAVTGALAATVWVRVRPGD
jgi:curved DNA-binding protein CbpA